MNAAELERAEFIDALSNGASGQIHLASGDSLGMVRRHLREAAFELGLRVQTWCNERTTLHWRRVP